MQTQAGRLNRLGGQLAFDEMVTYGDPVSKRVVPPRSRQLECLEVVRSPMTGEQINVEGERIKSVVR